jgi:hypothetical protein
LQDPWFAELDAIGARVVDAIGRDEVSPVAALFLLRHYVSTQRDDLRDPLGVALAQALAVTSDETDTRARAAWLVLFVEAAAITDDDRILRAADALVGGLRAAWPVDSASAAGLIASAVSVDACLRASSLFDPSELVPPAIDELERSVGGAYRPGESLLVARTFLVNDAEVLATHVHAAAALLTAYEITGRLPYSMLAEELMHSCRRPSAGDEGDVQCETARVLCRLAALHDDADYRRAAVLAPDADYKGDAARILREHNGLAYAGQVARAARYGIALRELMSLR